MTYSSADLHRSMFVKFAVFIWQFIYLRTYSGPDFIMSFYYFEMSVNVMFRNINYNTTIIDCEFVLRNSFLDPNFQIYVYIGQSFNVSLAWPSSLNTGKISCPRGNILTY